MKDKRGLSGWPLRGTGGIILALSAVVLMAGGGAAWWSWNRLASNPDDVNPTQVDGSASPNSPANADPSNNPVAIAPTLTKTVTVYLLDANETSMALVPVTVDADVAAETAEEPATILTAAFDQLLQENIIEEDRPVFSALSADTELLALNVEGDGVHVDLSGAFTEGGGSASMIGRLTQVIYTATSLDAEQPVWLSVDGQPLTLLGGEGLEIAQPMTRAMVDEDFPLL